MRLFRLAKIVSVSLRFGLDRMVLDADSSGRLAHIWHKVFFWRKYTESRGARLRQALESLGPIFIKFGQMLSTRRDLLPPDLADELALLQDRVPPFPTEQALEVLEGFYGKPIDTVFDDFERTPVASASVAQVHFARLPDGTDVAVKVLRPGIERVIEHDLALLEVAANAFCNSSLIIALPPNLMTTIFPLCSFIHGRACTSVLANLRASSGA